MAIVLKRTLAFRLLCMLLIVFLLFAFFMMPHAQAVVAEVIIAKYAVEIVGSILIALGLGKAIQLINWGDVRSLATEIVNWLEDSSPEQYVALIGLATTAYHTAQNPGQAAAVTLGIRVSQSLYKSIVESPILAMLLPSVGGKAPVIPAGFTKFLFDSKGGYDSAALNSFFASANAAKIPMYMTDWDIMYMTIDDSGNLWQHIDRALPTNPNFQQTSQIVGTNVTSAWFNFDTSMIRYQYVSGGRTYTGNLTGFYTWYEDKVGFYPYPRYYLSQISYPADILPLTGDLVYPGDDFLVKAPDIPYPDVDTGDMIYPPQSLNPEDHTVDLPMNPAIPGEYVDVPADTWVDVGTGDITDSYPDAKPDTKPDVKPGEGSLDLPTFKRLSIPKLIITKFPFCIPFDVYKMVSMLSVDPVAPVFRIPIKIPRVVDDSIVLDFSQFALLVSIIRWGEYVCFLGGLALVTRNYIKW